MNNADELRRKAADHRSDAAASFERCDTDGFLSQWASDINARAADRNADIADHGGMWTFERVILERLDGSPVEARRVDTRYGERWRVDADDAWLPVEPKRASTLAKRGFRERVETVIAPARAILWSPPGARGMAGATSVSVIIIRTDIERRDGWRPVGAPEA
jgi:hypothetical protein